MIVRIKEMHGAANLSGKEVVLLICDFMKPFHEGLSAVKLNEKLAYLNQVGGYSDSHQAE